MTRTFASGTALLAAAVLIAGCGTSTAQTTQPDSHGLVHIAVGVSPTTASIPVYLAQHEQAFAAAGLQVDLSTIQSGAEAVPRLLNGSLDIALGDAVGTTQSAGNGVPLRIVGVATIAPTTAAKDYSAIVAAPGSHIAGATGLNGRTIAVNQLNGIAELTTKAAIDALHGNSATVKFIELPFSQMPAAVKAGRVDAALIAEPYLTQAKDEGLSAVLAPQAYALPGLPTTIIVAASSYATQNSATIAKFLDVISAAGTKADNDPSAGRAVAGFTQLPPNVLNAITLPVYAGHAADTSGMNQLIALMNKYAMLAHQPDRAVLLGGSAKATP